MLKVTVGTIELDLGVVRRGGEELVLTPNELEFLQILTGEPGRIFSRSELNSRVLGYHPRTTSRALDTTVQRLRKNRLSVAWQ